MNIHVLTSLTKTCNRNDTAVREAIEIVSTIIQSPRLYSFVRVHRLWRSNHQPNVKNKKNRNNIDTVCEKYIIIQKLFNTCIVQELNKNKEGGGLEGEKSLFTFF